MLFKISNIDFVSTFLEIQIKLDFSLINAVMSLILFYIDLKKNVTGATNSTGQTNQNTTLSSNNGTGNWTGTGSGTGSWTGTGSGTGTGTGSGTDTWTGTGSGPGTGSGTGNWTGAGTWGPISSWSNWGTSKPLTGGGMGHMVRSVPLLLGSVVMYVSVLLWSCHVTL